MIAQSDKERAPYNHTFTGKEWADARQYDLSIDTSKIGVDKSVEVHFEIPGINLMQSTVNRKL